MQSLLWLDGCLLYNSSTVSLPSTLRLFLDYCSTYDWKLHPSMCVIYTTKVKLCGRIISFEGIGQDPKRVDGILDMHSLTTGVQLKQFVCAMQCLRSSIPDF